MRRQIVRLDRLVNELLDVSRIAAGQLPVTLEDVDLGALAREIVDRFSNEATTAGCAVTVAAETAVRGRWDRSRLDQVLTNLLTNAMKYGRGRPIEVAVEESEGNGAFDGQRRGHRHRPRASGTRLRAVRARGLGLELRWPWAGPVDCFEDREAARGQRMRREFSRRGRYLHRGASAGSCMKRILVVEDDADLGKTVARCLSDEGYEIEIAADGHSALEALRRSPCDLVLLDLMMPKMNGWEFRARQLADPSLASIPVVVMTATSDLSLGGDRGRGSPEETSRARGRTVDSASAYRR